MKKKKSNEITLVLIGLAIMNFFEINRMIYKIILGFLGIENENK